MTTVRISRGGVISAGIWHGRLINVEGEPCPTGQPHRLFEIDGWGRPTGFLTCAEESCSYFVDAVIPDDLAGQTDHPGPYGPLPLGNGGFIFPPYTDAWATQGAYIPPDDPRAVELQPIYGFRPKPRNEQPA